MQPTRLFASAITAAGLLVLPAQADFAVQSLYARDVRQGYSVALSIDSLLVDTRVGSGVAHTTLTLVVTPSFYQECSYVAGAYRPAGVERAFDSIEITGSLSLPTDFAATNLWLWVNGERQVGYIQDRALAWQQYSSIVGVRRDPALLETWGNGSYNLRVFPARSGVARRFSIEFQHTFDDDSADLITALLPFTYDSLYYYYYSSCLRDDARTVGYASVRLASTDGRTYQCAVPGLGEGAASGTRPLLLQGRDVAHLGAGVVVVADPSGSREYFWAATDRNGDLTSGLTAMLSESTLTLEPEPDVRVVVIDVRSQLWDWGGYYAARAESQGYTTTYSGYEQTNMWLRAQKYAVLALRNYVAADQRFNLVIAGAGGAAAVFPAPVSPTADNLQAAYQAILQAKPCPGASTEAALAEALAQAPQGVVVLVSDQYQPADYYSTSGGSYAASQNGRDFDSLMARCGRLLDASQAHLYTIADAWQLTSLATRSGGYNLASLRYPYYWSLSDGNGQAIGIAQLPALFKPSWGGLRVDTVTAQGLADVAWTTDGSSYSRWGGGDVFMVRAVDAPIALARTAVDRMPGYYGASQALLRVAGKAAREHCSREVSVTVTGTLGGLRFTQEFSGKPDWVGADTGAVQWALRRSEQLAAADWQANNAAIEALGREYHIVTRQTSLLALEPGMVLWEDTTSPPAAATADASSANARTAGVALEFSMVASDTVVTSGSFSIDEVTLEQLMNASGALLARIGPASRMQVRAVAGRIEVALPNTAAGSKVSLALYSMSGRLVAARTMTTSAGRVSWNVRSAAGLARGNYTLRVRSGSQEQRVSVSLAF